MTVDDAKFEALERRVAKIETTQAVDYERHQSVIRRLDKIDGHISKLVWLVIVAIIGGFMTFILKGGLNV